MNVKEKEGEQDQKRNGWIQLRIKAAGVCIVYVED